MNRLTNSTEIEDARRRIAELLDACGEWFLRERRDGAAVELRRGEWELRVASGALLLSYWGEAGARTWRVAAWELNGGRLALEAARRTGAVRARLELVPRARAASAREAVASARRAVCERLATLVCASSGARLEQARVSAGARRGEPGRWAHILLRRGRVRIAATAPVVAVGAEVAESFLSSALLWLARLEGGPRAVRAQELWLVAPTKLAAAIAERLALLREDLRAVTSVFELNDERRGPTNDEGRSSTKDKRHDLTDDEHNGLTKYGRGLSDDDERGDMNDDGRGGLTQIRVPGLEELLDAPAPHLSRRAEQTPCELVRSIVALAPEEIDVVRARHGETLRFLGLPFARVRRVMGAEHLWFGVESAPRRTPLDEESAPDLLKLVEELKEHRRASAMDHRHALYRAAPEAWLESILRRDITRLDPGLRLAPLHAQFRAAHDAHAASRPVDLLALRRDGRLVVIELKVSEDAALALQGADYWRRIEQQRRCGNVARARLFDDARVADCPPLVYLVAPMLRFHRSFAALARAIAPEIEMYRFDLGEDWRACVRVVRRVPLHD